jgi:hypothetical protein
VYDLVEKYPRNFNTLPQHFAGLGYAVRGLGKVFHHFSDNNENFRPYDPVDQVPFFPSVMSYHIVPSFIKSLPSFHPLSFLLSLPFSLHIGAPEVDGLVPTVRTHRG